MVIFHKILGKLEGKLELNLKVFMKNFSYMFTNNIVTIIFAMLLSIMLARVLSKDVFGQYNLIISIFGLVSILSLPGMNSSITRSCARGFDGSFFEGTKSRIRWGLAGSFALFIIGLYYYTVDLFNLSFGLLVAAMFFIPYFSFRTYGGYLLSKKRFKTWSLYLSIVTIVANLTTAIIAYYFRNLLIVILVLLGMASIINIILLFKTLKEKENNRVDAETVPYGKRLTAVIILSMIKSHLDKIIIGLFLGFEALAIYSVAITIPRQVKPIWTTITNMIFSDLSKKKKNYAYLAVRKRFRYVMLLSILIIIIGILVMPPLIYYLYSSKYLDSIFYAQLLMLITLSGPSIILVNLATAQKQLRKVYNVSTIPAVIHIVLLIILTPLYGIMGATIATIIGGGLMPLIFSWVYILRSSKKVKSLG